MTEAKNEWGTNKIPLHQESLNFFMRMGKVMGGKLLHQMSVEEAREAIIRMFENVPPPFDGTVEEKRIPSKAVKDGIPVRIYKPSNAPSIPKILVNFHGGAYIFGNIEGTRGLIQTISPLCGLIIVDVDYRLCPEHKLPAGMEDCAEVTRWVLDNKTAVGGVPESPVGVSGDSAGGGLAIYVTHKVKGLQFQVLMYPWGDFTGASPSAKEFGDLGPKEITDWLMSLILEEGASRDDPRWSNVYHKVEDCVGLPPALIILAQVDGIRDDGRRYAKLLIDAGVYTSIFEVKGAYHGFCSLPDTHPELTAQAYDKLKTFLSGI